jgi:hypothetical protein
MAKKSGNAMSEGMMVHRWRAQTYNPVGFCIYCGSAELLSDEHIVPFGLLPKGGDWLLPKASCAECARVTAKFEGSVQQNMIGPIRQKMGLKSRRKAKESLTATFNYPDGRLEEEVIPAGDFPSLCIGMRWRAPRLLRGLPSEDLFEGEAVKRFNEEEVKRFAEPDRAFKVGRVYPGDFARMLAKIAHAYAFAEFGPGTFEPMLPDYILGKSNHLAFVVGGDESGSAYSSEPVLHHVYRQDCLTNGVHYMLVGIRLFACLGMPTYHVVVGPKTDQTAPHERSDF